MSDMKRSIGATGELGPSWATGFQHHELNVVDNEFNNIMTEDVKILIARAFISLESGMRRGRLWEKFHASDVELLERKASQMKQEINDFIDSQKQRIITASEVRWHNGFQVPE